MTLNMQVKKWQRGYKKEKLKKVFIEEGFEHLPKAFRNLFTGENFGKQIVKVSENV